MKKKESDTRKISKVGLELAMTTAVLMILFSLFALWCQHRAIKEGLQYGVYIQTPNGTIYPNPDYKPKPEENTVDPE